MHRVKLNSLAALVLAVALLPAAYMGAYYAMISGSTPHLPRMISTPNGGVRELPNYRFGQSVADVIFLPAHQVDRSIRPDRWIELTPEELRLLQRPAS